MAGPGSPCYRLGEFILESDQHRLTRAGEEIPLRPKSFEFLLYLVEHHGNLVTKDELLDAIWPDSYVSEGTLRQIVWEIREALGEHKDQQRLIKTIPKIGYQFIGEVHEAKPKIPGGRNWNLKAILLITTGILIAAGILLPVLLWLWPEPPQPEPGNPLIAVLPFENLSPNHEDEYFSRGVAEDIITILSKIEGLRVVSLTSLIDNRSLNKDLEEIVEELGVTAIIEGSARHAEDKVKISARLTDAVSHEQLWAESYEQESTGIFEIQGKVARSVAAALKGRLDNLDGYPLARISPERAKAHDLVLRARFCQIRGEFKQSTAYCEQAIKIDPSYAVPYAEIAFKFYIDAIQATDEERDEIASQAEEYVRRALELDDSLAEPHWALALLKDARFDWTGSEREIRTAIDLNPNHWKLYHQYAELLIRLGRYEEALRFAELAYELEPFDRGTIAYLAYSQLFTGRPDKALETAREMVGLYPRQHFSYIILAEIYKAMASCDQGIEVLNEARDKADYNDFNCWYIGLQGHLYVLTGEDTEARDCLRQLNDMAIINARTAPANASYWHMAIIHMAMGEEEKALDNLEKCGYWIIGGPFKGISQDPFWDPLRSNPRFQVLLKKTKLPEESIRKPGEE